MDSGTMVVVTEAQKLEMARHLGALMRTEGAARPDLPRWDLDDALLILSRLESPGRGDYDARARGS